MLRLTALKLSLGIAVLGSLGLMSCADAQKGCATDNECRYGRVCSDGMCVGEADRTTPENNGVNNGQNNGLNNGENNGFVNNGENNGLNNENNANNGLNNENNIANNGIGECTSAFDCRPGLVCSGFDGFGECVESTSCDGFLNSEENFCDVGFICPENDFKEGHCFTERGEVMECFCYGERFEVSFRTDLECNLDTVADALNVQCGMTAPVSN